MSSSSPIDLSVGFQAPKKSLRGLKPDAAAFAIAASADIAFVLNAKGVIEDVSVANPNLIAAPPGSLMGEAWADTVTPECVDKVKRAIAKAQKSALSDWHEINYPSTGEADAPFRFIVVRLDQDRGHKLLALGRDQRRNASLQRRLVFAQQEMEREYAKVRDSEARYRILFQHSEEAVMVTDAQSMRVQELNPAAAHLLKTDPDRVAGKSIAQVFSAKAQSDLATLHAMARASGSAEAKGLALAKGKRTVDVFAACFNVGRVPRVLLRLAAQSAAATDGEEPYHSGVSAIMDASPEGIVVTDVTGQVRFANPAFLDMLQVSTPDAVVGRSLSDWIGRPGADYGVLETRVREDGSLRFFETLLTSTHGDTMDVEISGVVVPDAEPAGMGFIIRNLGGRLSNGAALRGALPEAVEQMRELVGRVPLKELVRETTDIIEKMCIEAALELTNDNRASASELLGLSRQSLYVKLRRYDLDGAEDS
ncbi:MAG: transcriptional regulator PpsR [Pseudomonadota bacterium]